MQHSINLNDAHPTKRLTITELCRIPVSESLVAPLLRSTVLVFRMWIGIVGVLVALQMVVMRVPYRHLLRMSKEDVVGLGNVYQIAASAFAVGMMVAYRKYKNDTRNNHKTIGVMILFLNLMYFITNSLIITRSVPILFDARSSILIHPVRTTTHLLSHPIQIYILSALQKLSNETSTSKFPVLSLWVLRSGCSLIQIAALVTRGPVGRWLTLGGSVASVGMVLVGWERMQRVEGLEGVVILGGWVGEIVVWELNRSGLIRFGTTETAVSIIDAITILSFSLLALYHHLIHKPKPRKVTIRPATVIAVDIPVLRTQDRYSRTDLVQEFEEEMMELAGRYGLERRLGEVEVGVWFFSVDGRTVGMAA
ncbi:hypothetical protein BC829DRAFT_386242, partial [Chytridium lagenaria]